MSEPDRQFGDRLKFLRQGRGLKQEELAERIGKPQSTVSAYEANKRSPTLEVLEAIAAALDCSLLDLLTTHEEEDLEAPLRDWKEALLELLRTVENRVPPAEVDDLALTLQVIIELRLRRWESKPKRAVRPTRPVHLERRSPA